LKRPLVFLLLVLLAAISCSADPEIEVDTTIPPTAMVGGEDSTPSPTAAAESTSEPTRDPIRASISSSDQPLSDDNEIEVEEVVSPTSGWLVVYSYDSGVRGRIVGYAALTQGSNKAIKVSLEPLSGSRMVEAVLHDDKGVAGTFEFPGDDEPIMASGSEVRAEFTVTSQSVAPLLLISDQDVTEEGYVEVLMAVSPVDGWLSIQSSNRFGETIVLGRIHMPAGEGNAIRIPIEWRKANSELTAVLHRDSGQIGLFDYPEADPPVEVLGEVVAASFSVTLPPDLVILDQPVIDESIEVERVVSTGPGWIAVYADNEGSAGRLIGWSALLAGLNELVVVPIDGSGVTVQLHVRLHEETEESGTFNFPAADPPLRRDGQLLAPASFRIDRNNYLYASDQNIVDGTVTIPVAVVAQPSWLVIYTDENGERGEFIGAEWMAAGINRKIAVNVDSDLVTETLHAVVHRDGGREQEFDFPNEVDTMLIQNGQPVTISFSVK